ncbi:IS21 family transposase [Flavihumibacter rivuli]|uniref:IS21 family transposase n=1 Tax=Flavihumibacter rivuli TaxID=2838156 RepID=UPI001BDF4C7A|nr:IS21 family transposase [Flavihumibacter rivuli]ULQ55456.1 IS21 family transposase [Flavihumibacter rivuli]ULQ55970.1 IS21 family transposase [Flavihumibacter rivuli]
MAANPIKMDQLKQVLSLHQQGKSIKAIARLTGIARNTIRGYLRRGQANECNPLLDNDKELAAALYNQDSSTYKSKAYQCLLLHFEGIEQELARPGVTRLLLWREYREQHPDGYEYSQYCYYLKAFLRNKDVSMHLEYRAAEQIMIDFAGKKQYYIDSTSKERISCEVFVATLPFSGLIFCYAVPSQKTADFLECCNQMLRYFGGSPQTILCDNLSTAVTRSDKYEPVFTDLCYQLSEHYGTTFSATRPYEPRDKAMVEKAVRIVYQNVYAPLRKHTFHSLAELNHHFLQQLERLNKLPYKGSSFSRQDLFLAEEQPLLKTLPSAPLCLKKGTVLTVQRNYHIQLREDGLYYSVPWQYAGQKVKVWYDHRSVEIYHDHQRIAWHPRSVNGRGYTTLGEHMPPNHQAMAARKGWTQEGLLSKAYRIGPCVGSVAEKILGNSVYMEQNYKSCYGMLMLEKRYGSQRLEAACQLALTGMRINYTMIKNILHCGKDKQVRIPNDTPLPSHTNIRGPQQYQ